MGFQDSMNFYKTCTASELTCIDTILTSDNSSRFIKNLLEWI